MLRAPIVACLAVIAANPLYAKERATFLRGTYATKQDCEKQRAIDAGGPRNVETAPELLDRDGFNSWEGSCEFTKVLQHDSTTWVGLMVCHEGAAVTPQTYVFQKIEGRDAFDVAGANQEAPDEYVRCDPKKGR